MPKIDHRGNNVQSKHIGTGTRIWQYVVILEGAKIGHDVNICSHCFIENDVVIGDRVTIKNGNQLWDGLRVGDDAFIGPNVTFTNDKFPRSGQHPAKFSRTIIGEGASIGGGAVVLPGIRIGKSAMIGAGSVVTSDVQDFSLVIGNPAKHQRFIESE